MAGWEITPTEHQKDQLKMTRADVIAFTQARVKVLLHRDAFCDEGVNDDVSVHNHITTTLPLNQISGPVIPL